MPYLLPKDRPPVDDAIKPFLDYLIGQPFKNIAGIINYVLCKVFVRLRDNRDFMRYFNWAWFRGTIADAVDEMRDKQIKPYEAMKCEENGDVF